MSQINLHNYEAFFLDYIEGNLPAEKVAELLLFLEKNPSLKDELDDFDFTELTPSENRYLDKKSLHQTINSTNIENYIIEDLEGIIASEDKNDLNSYLQNDQKAQQLADRYSKTKLIPATIVFPEKRSLKKHNRVIVLYSVVGLAASFLLLFILNSIPDQEQRYSPYSLSENIEALDETQPDTTMEKPQPLTVEVAENTQPEKKRKVPKKIKPIQPNKELNNIAIAPEISVTNDSVPAIHPEKILSPQQNAVVVNENTDNEDNLLAISNSESMSIKEWSNKTIRKKILKQDAPSTEKINNDEVLVALANGVDKLTRKEVSYNHATTDDYKSYSISFGKFEFSRSKRKK